MGEKVREFEAAFARKLGRKYGVMVNSGSSANLVSTAALFYRKDRPLRPGDEMIVPALSWATTYSPLQQHGLKLRVVDIDRDTLNIDLGELRRALTPRTRAVVAVSILGNPAPLPEIRKFCDEHGLSLLEDNCESLGARVGGRACGSFGDLATHSTFYSHQISTMEGGVIVTDDAELYHLCLSLRAHGWTRDLPEGSPLFARKSDDFFEAYRFILPGYNVRPLELAGAVGLVQLGKLDAMVAARRRNAAELHSLFQGDERFILQKENGESSWFSFTVILNPKARLDRARILSALRKDGIEFRIITGGCFIRHEVARHYDFEAVGALPNACLAHDHGFFVGNFPVDGGTELRNFHRILTSAAGA
jgi:CDP-6-deoxy-D-xylo-4-hexulose-3-dehydrase